VELVVEGAGGHGYRQGPPCRSSRLQGTSCFRGRVSYVLLIGPE
jgi:hypothetical protein